ncbi:taste receptor type 2 member 40-like [Spea bombifrons]|uniref:taste receptor type 2 member 40-like n=1 Tax=Spea bombifrons TaxID=233779 RepID=UPI002349DD15|nr:taste receptor type 2 member 40-like [Spea bombifrons]
MDALTILTLTIGVGIGSVSFASNSWILAVNMKDYCAGIRLNPCDRIMTFIGLTNLMMQTALTSGSLFNAFDCHMMYIGELHLLVVQCLIFLSRFNLWLTIWLSVYYCLKIVNFAHGVLFILKTRISGLMPKLLIFSFVESLVITIPSYWSVTHDNSLGFLENATCAWQDCYCTMSVEFGYWFFILFMSIVSLAFTLIPFGVTVHSLWKHTKKMMENEFSCIQIQAHVTASRTISLLSLLFVTFYAALITVILQSYNFKTPSGYSSVYFMLFYPTFQAIVIITGNSKLRKAGKLLKNQFGVCLRGDSHGGK